MAGEPRIFWDADALIAGVHSETGAAGVLLLAAEQRQLTGLISPFVLEECRRNLTFKLPVSLPRLDELLDRAFLEVTKQPSKEALAAYAHLADTKDVPHVAAAHQAGVVYLVTFNLRHYQREAIAAELGIRVLNPGELLKELREAGLLPQGKLETTDPAP